ncbi:NAD(P)H-binding protein [Haloarchaeobius sp. TZWWS8]|uniref:NAD(P)H-binding protein n=1 Tax=Haloarchaeobius sp. TZWWS8 TaxID=3446121 RepID=UPI003EBD3FE1
MRVLVTGATGFVGSHLVPALVEAGHDVVALVRDATRYDGPEAVTVVQGDLLDPGTLPPAFEGVDAAYYLVHSMHSGTDFEERDRIAARNFVDAASATGVDRVVYLGGLGEERDHLSKHLRSRREVEFVLEGGDYDLTVLRAAIIVGPGSASFEMIRQLVSRLPVMVTPRWVRTPCQPIAIEDVVAYLVGVLDVPATAGGTYQIGGQETLTYQEMLERTARVMGRRLRVVPVPVLSPELSAYWVELVTNVPKSVSRPLITGLRNPVVCTENEIRDLLPIELTPFDRAVERALLAEDAVSVQLPPEVSR